ncbi:DUF4349 domain-containing protein [Leptospira ognonensis]|uniref:DUF4349 domain-containing protein n=1 Tax=Leptospira ognonensis TaxID=2484945 RepID=A0A4R9K6L8_9LEPT|nr:DUF4349 domain-containing protein [Leptospira ognonensis]TGL61915.1 DUF4349 domain-containing protein [Leptospira ognonensis]
MNQKLFFATISSVGIFLILFGFRISYGYYSKSSLVETESNTFLQSSAPREILPLKQNIASKKIKYESTTGTTPRSVDQKYEKIATVETKSTDISSDEKKVRDFVNASGSIIQYENNSGLKENQSRVIKLAIGVPPDKFDSMVEEFKKIGTTVLLTIDKKDKTNEYKDLQAKKESLLKIRDSLISLKGKGGRIDEFISLENRILEIEDEIQKFGISLGEFDSENEFCTVVLTLFENKPSVAISLLHRIRVALEWSIKYYFLITFGFLCFIVGIHYAFIVFEKLRRIVSKEG